jgi:hypothetical protein
VPNLLMLASGAGLVAATAALWVQGWRRTDHRFFAALISIAVTLSLFSVVAWAVTAIAPCLLPAFLSARSLFSSRCDCIDSYRSRRRANVLLSRARLNWRQHITWLADPRSSPDGRV